MIIQLTGALAKRGMEYIGLGKLSARIFVFVEPVTTIDPIVIAAREAPTISLSARYDPTVGPIAAREAPTISVSARG